DIGTKAEEATGDRAMDQRHSQERGWLRLPEIDQSESQTGGGRANDTPPIPAVQQVIRAKDRRGHHDRRGRRVPPPAQTSLHESPEEQLFNRRVEGKIVDTLDGKVRTVRHEPVPSTPSEIFREPGSDHESGERQGDADEEIANRMGERDSKGGHGGAGQPDEYQGHDRQRGQPDEKVEPHPSPAGGYRSSIQRAPGGYSL